MTKRLIIDPQTATFQELEPAAKILLNGGLIAAPTGSFYALMGRVDHPESLQKVLELKANRSSQQAFLILLDHPQRVRCYAREIPDYALKFIESFWPGSLSLLFLAQPALHPCLLGPNKTVGLRVESLPAIRKLIRRIDRGLTGTSANPSGEKPASTADEVENYFHGKLDLIIDGGQTEGFKNNLASTIIDVTMDTPLLMRPGSVSSQELLKVYPNWKI